MAWSVPAPYAQAVRSGFTLTYTVDVTRSGLPVRTGLQPTGGSVSDTTKPGARRALSLELAPEPGLYDALNAYGTTLTVSAHIAYTNQTAVAIPMGVFDLNQSSLDEGGGKLSLTAPDKWVRIQRNNFTSLVESTATMAVVEQITTLIRGALGASEPVNVLTSSTATVGSLTWDPAQTSRAQAILDLAEGAGLWVFFDRNGVATIADVPLTKPNADWLLDASVSGVLTSLARQQDRTGSANVVVVSSSSSSGATFPDQVAFDTDVTSPTYAGPDPLNHPELAGPFGVVVYRYSSPLPLTTAEAWVTASAILSKTVGIASQASLGSTPNPAMDAFDALDVIGPRQRYDIARLVERHVADTVTHPLDVTQPLQVQGRSTRTDPYT